MMFELFGWRRTRTRRTFVVLGCPRGGTSLIAGALSAAGVYMGEYRTTQYEDPQFKIPPKEAGDALARLTPVIAARNRQHRYWGWKVPNNVYYIERVRHLLINPCFLFVYRDPERIARSSARHDGRDWSEQGEHLLRVAVNHTERVRAFQATLHAGVHVFQLEAIHADPAGFVDELRKVVAPLTPDRQRLLQFVNPEGGYHSTNDR